MEKYLFKDGTNEVREVQSKGELSSLIESIADRSKIRIWIFKTSRWITYEEWINIKDSGTISPKKLQDLKTSQPINHQPKKWAPWKRILIGIGVALVIFLIYNFTRETWEKQPDLVFIAPRPLNVPLLNNDSLVQEIELARSQKIDKVTRTNLRIRNSWPEMLQLQMTASVEKSQHRQRYANVSVSLDNSTGYNLDDVTLKFVEWKNNEVVGNDTLHFKNLGYSSPVHRTINGVFNGDSISIAIASIRSKVFNFCYAVDKKSNYGNMNDRWFCKE